MRDAELGRRFADQLVKVWRLGSEEAWVLVHVEVQSQEESTFEERMFVYFYRIYDRYRRQVVSLAVLGDTRSTWRPNQFSYALWGCEVSFRFPVVKLLDYQQQWTVLEASRNPFATVVMAHLQAQETRLDAQGRLVSKLALTRRLYEQGYERQDVVNLFCFIDWVMNLPAALEQEFWQAVRNLEEERRMPYITSVERIAIQKGIEQGIEQGREQMRQVLLESLELGLELKFGSEGLGIFPEISQIYNLEQLRAIQMGLRTAQTLEELRQVYRGNGVD